MRAKKVGVTLECVSSKSSLNFRGTVDPQNLLNEMFLETIPRKLSATKIKRYTVLLYSETCLKDHLYPDTTSL